MMASLLWQKECLNSEESSTIPIPEVQPQYLVFNLDEKYGTFIDIGLLKTG